METPSEATAQLLATIRKAGLTESQAHSYLALIEHGQLTPAELAEKTGESRTNGYMICEKLASLGLATKKDDRKVVYRPTHPSALESLAERRRKVLVRNEQEVKRSLSPLLDMFYAVSETPGTRTLQGVEGIKEVYADTLRTKSDIYLVRTTADTPDLGIDFLTPTVSSAQTRVFTPTPSLLIRKSLDSIKKAVKT